MAAAFAYLVVAAWVSAGLFPGALRGPHKARECLLALAVSLGWLPVALIIVLVVLKHRHSLFGVDNGR